MRQSDNKVRRRAANRRSSHVRFRAAFRVNIAPQAVHFIADGFGAKCDFVVRWESGQGAFQDSAGDTGFIQHMRGGTIPKNMLGKDALHLQRLTFATCQITGDNPEDIQCCGGSLRP